MNRKLKRFIVNMILTTVQISFVTCIGEALRDLFGGEALTLMVWGLYLVLIIAICLFAWRFYTGIYRDGDFLDDY